MKIMLKILCLNSYLNTSPIVDPVEHNIRPHQCDKGGQIAIAALEPFDGNVGSIKFGRIFHVFPGA